MSYRARAPRSIGFRTQDVPPTPTFLLALGIRTFASLRASPVRGTGKETTTTITLQAQLFRQYSGGGGDGWSGSVAVMVAKRFYFLREGCSDKKNLNKEWEI